MTKHLITVALAAVATVAAACGGARPSDDVTPVAPVASADETTSLQQQFVNLQRGTPGPLEPPVDSMEGRLSELERSRMENMLACSFIGSPETIRPRLSRFLARTGADELIVLPLSGGCSVRVDGRQHVLVPAGTTLTDWALSDVPRVPATR